MDICFHHSKLELVLAIPDLNNPRRDICACDVNERQDFPNLCYVVISRLLRHNTGGPEDVYDKQQTH